MNGCCQAGCLRIKVTGADKQSGSDNDSGMHKRDDAAGFSQRSRRRWNLKNV
jgi:hypothetical protein